MKKLLTWLILPPITIVMVAFAIANRNSVAVSFDPIPYQIELPMYGVLFVGILLGLFAGGVLTWLGQGKWRQETRARRRENRSLTRDLAETQAQSASATSDGNAQMPQQTLLPR